MITVVQPKLKLSLEQQKEWLGARAQLLKQLAEIRKKRESLTLGLGLLMLQNRQVLGLQQTPLLQYLLLTFYLCCL